MAISVRVPGAKSISHRALMLAPLARGVSRIRGLSSGVDVLSTARALRALGAGVDLGDRPENELIISGPCDLASPAETINCGNSGTTARLLLGLIAGRAVSATLTGDASLRSRPMGRVIEPLRAAGATVREWGAGPGLLPLEIVGSGVTPIEHSSPLASAQVKSALLLAGLGSGVAVTVTEPGPSRDHTERMLQAMGARVDSMRDGSAYRVIFQPGSEELTPLDLSIPGDISAAAFWACLAVMGGAGPGLRIESVGLNPRRTGFLRVLEEMGARIRTELKEGSHAEPLGDLEVEPAELEGIELPPEWLPTLIDEIPVLACVAARARGTFTLRGAAELRVKESDRINVLCRNLAAVGVTVTELADGMIIEGSDARLVGQIEVKGDHRIAMAFGVLDALPGNDIVIDNQSSVSVSYPGFWEQLHAIQEEAA